MKKQIIALISLMSFAPALWAHGGDDHHGFMATLWHVLTHADHLLGIIAGSVITLGLIAVGLKLKRNANRKLAASHK